MLSAEELFKAAMGMGKKNAPLGEVATPGINPGVPDPGPAVAGEKPKFDWQPFAAGLAQASKVQMQNDAPQLTAPMQIAPRQQVAYTPQPMGNTLMMPTQGVGQGFMDTPEMMAERKRRFMANPFARFDPTQPMY